jgi:hypothetical protein
MGFPFGNMQRSVTARSRYPANAMYLSRILPTKLDHAYSPVSSTGSSSSLCYHLDLGVSTCILQYSNNSLRTDTSVHHHSSLPIRPNFRISMPSGSQLLSPASLLCSISHCLLYSLCVQFGLQYLRPRSAVHHALTRAVRTRSLAHSSSS